MITIRIENAEEIVKQEKGFFVSKLAPYFIDIQAKVEQAIAEEIRTALQEKNVEAEVVVVADQ